MASETTPMTLEKIQYFLHVLSLKQPDEVYVVSIGDEVPVCLKAYKLFISEIPNHRNEELRMLKETTTELQNFKPILRWKMMVQESKKEYNSNEEVMAILKDTRGVFGVWGEKQRAYFAQFLDNVVVDIAPLVMERVVKFDQEKDLVIKPYEKCLLLTYLTIGELFLYILRKPATYFYFENLSTNKSSQEAFERYIEEIIWMWFVCRVAFS